MRLRTPYSPTQTHHKRTHRLPDRRKLRHRHRQRHRRRHTHTDSQTDANTDTDTDRDTDADTHTHTHTHMPCHHGRDTWGLRRLGAQRPLTYIWGDIMKHVPAFPRSLTYGTTNIQADAHTLTRTHTNTL